MQFLEASKQLKLQRISRTDEQVRLAARLDAVWLSAAVSMMASEDEIRNAAAGLSKLAEEKAGHFHWLLDNGSLEIMFAMAKKDELHATVRLRSEPDFLDQVTILFVLSQAELPRLQIELLNLAK